MKKTMSIDLDKEQVSLICSTVAHMLLCMTEDVGKSFSGENQWPHDETVVKVKSLAGVFERLIEMKKDFADEV